MPPPAAPRSPEGPAFSLSEGYRRYVLGLLFTVYVVNFVDRQIMTILVEPIRAEFGFSDAQLGVLTGLAFALLYATLGIPIARYADRHSRVRVISLAIFVWSLFTALTGLARTYLHFLLARIAVGIGEAGCSPPAYSLISDYFPPERRATALSTYSMGIFGGVFVGYLLGGNVAESLGWRAAFFIVGVPGLAVALLVRLTLREPPRGFSDPEPAPPGDPPPIGRALAALWSKRSFRHLSIAAALHAFVGYGVGGFLPAFLIRSHGMTVSEVGNWLALISAGGGLVGTYLGGAVSDRLAKARGDARYYMWVPGLSTLVSVPLALLVYLLPVKLAVLLLMIPTGLLGAMYLGPTFAMTQGLVGTRERALAGAILLFIINLIGLGGGPWITGVLSDAVRAALAAGGADAVTAKAQGLRYALAFMVCVNLWSAVHYAFAARSLRGDLAAARAAAAETVAR